MRQANWMTPCSREKMVVYYRFLFFAFELNEITKHKKSQLCGKKLKLSRQCEKHYGAKEATLTPQN
jgi:hypothetical protein